MNKYKLVIPEKVLEKSKVFGLWLDSYHELECEKVDFLNDESRCAFVWFDDNSFLVPKNWLVEIKEEVVMTAQSWVLKNIKCENCYDVYDSKNCEGCTFTPKDIISAFNAGEKNEALKYKSLVGACLDFVRNTNLDFVRNTNYFSDSIFYKRQIAEELEKINETN